MMNKITFPLKSQRRGQKVADLQDALKLALDRGAILADDPAVRLELEAELQRERERQYFGKITKKLVAAFQRERQLQPTGDVDEPTANAINALLIEWSELEEPSEGKTGEDEAFVVHGRVVSRELRGLSGLRVVAVDKNVGRVVRVGQATSGERGAYEIRYSMARLNKEQPDIQVQVIDEGGEILAASAVRYNAGPEEKGLDVVVPAEKLPRPAEYRRLMDELSPHLAAQDEPQLKQRLATLHEDDGQQDITYLANKTGWDARLVAMTALASRFSERSGIEPEFYYALFRAGVPADEAALSQVAQETVRQAWERAVEQEILPGELQEKIPESLERFKAHSAGRLLEEPAGIGVSGFKELLQGALPDSGTQQRFARLYYDRRSDLASFWEQAQEEFGADVADRLRLDGKLAFLTINNAPLIQRLHAQNGDLRTPLDLVRRGLYQKEAWEPLLGDDVAIPDEIPGETPQEKQANYAAFMASQLRLSYPTAVVAEMVKADTIPLRVEKPIKDVVTRFLDEHQGKFELGIHPVERYLRKNDIELEGPDLSEEQKRDALAQVKKLQRVYQISPSDEAMGKLLEHDLDSAYGVVRYDEQSFVSAFKNELGGEAAARLTYAKAHQVHHAVLNIATNYLLERSAPSLYAIDNLPARNGVKATSTGLTVEETGVLAYPTLERIFGEMDYCACEHCRSWLSPAAYLVDLLQFLDPPTHAQENPLEVLLRRRPDIQHLQLTCENTNTVLPYIDLVNEVLEHYVVNGSLETFTGHNIEEGMTTEELLANPQFVDDAAYEELRTHLFPPPLPFHQPLEAARRYFEHFEVPLHEAMERLRANDSLERDGDPDDPAYGWQDILTERLKLSRREYGVLTDSSTLLQTLYGEDPDSVTVDELINNLTTIDIRGPDETTEPHPIGIGNARLFARKLGLRYEELIDIIRTRFMNPHSRLLPKLEKLHVDFATIQAFLDGTLSENDFQALLPDELDEAAYGGDVKQWLRNNEAQIMSLIVLSDPTGSENVCSFDTIELRYARPDFDNNRLRPIEFLKLLRFIRLWRKLGWSIEQTDRALTALYPAEDDDAETTESKLDAGFQTLIQRLAHLQTVMERLELTPKRDLLPLLACWSSIDTHGHRSLYRQMFRNPSVVALDNVFREDGYGGYLAEKKEFEASDAEPPRLLAHAEALRAAFNLTQEEFDRIVDALGFDAETRLTLADASAIFRHGYLARKLRLSVREFLALKALSGLDPFLPLDLAERPDPAEPLGVVRPQAIRFIELVQQIQASPFTVSQLLYLLRHADWSGKASPSKGDVLDFARRLRNDLLHIEQEHVVQDDPTEEIARDKMALVYGEEATDVFFGLLNKTAGQEAFAAFFERYPDLKEPYENFVNSNDPSEEKMSTLLADLLPDLLIRLKRQQVRQTVSAQVDVDLTMVTPLLEDASLLHAVTEPAKPAITDFLALGTKGLSADIFFSDDVAENADQTDVLVSNIDYREGGQTLPLNPAGNDVAISGKWHGFLEVPDNGSYDFYVEADADAAIVLKLDGQEVVVPTDGIWRSQNSIELQAGRLYALELTAKQVRDHLVLKWESKGMGRTTIPPKRLYPAGLVERFRATYLRLLKVLAIVDTLALDRAELEHFATHDDFLIDENEEGWLNALPVTAPPDAATAQKLLENVLALLQYRTLKEGLKTGDERLLEVLQDPAATGEDGEPLLERVTGWREADRTALLEHFGLATSDLTHLPHFVRLHEAFAVVKKVGIGAATLLEVTTNEPDADTVRNLQAALRARYDDNPESGTSQWVIDEVPAKGALSSSRDWLNLIQPINDELRSLQRDALVTFVLHRLGQDETTEHIDTPDKLFEYFLIDVQMDPCMKTSRIRQALSSVQLFVQRCLMGLEDRQSSREVKKLGTLRGHTDWVNTVAFNPEGTLVASGSRDRTIILWDVSDPRNPERVSSLDGGTGQVMSVAFNRDGTQLVGGTRNLAVILWDVSDPRNPAQLSVMEGHASPGPVNVAAFNHDGTRVVSGSTDRILILWDVSDPRNPEQLSVLEGHTGGAVLSAAFNQDGTRLVSGSSDRMIIFWDISDPRNPEQLSAWEGHDSGEVDSLAFHPDGTQVISSGALDRTAILWDVSDPRNPVQLSSLEGHGGTIRSVAFNHDGTQVVSGSGDRTLILWDVSDPRNPKLLSSLRGHSSRVNSVAFNHDGTLVVSAGSDRSIILWGRRESGVAASSINAKQWEWMKRYRVWEANRKVFLWPENWLEPELRDNKSSFFKDLESELLQSDITDDAAATALVHYLEKLDEVAKLEICGMYYEQNEVGNPVENVVHVIGRTAGARRTYYYRRKEGEGAWTPGEKVDLNIEDNPVLPVVWNGRLLLFWVSVQQEVPPETDDSDDTELDLGGKVKSSQLRGVADEAKTQVTVTLYWSEYYNGEWHPAKTSDPKRPIDLGIFAPSGDGAFDRSLVELRGLFDATALYVYVGYDSHRYPHTRLDGRRYSLRRGGYFKLYNTHAAPVRNRDDMDTDNLPPMWPYLREVAATNGVLRVSHMDDYHGYHYIPFRSDTVLQRQRLPGASAIDPRHDMEDFFLAPFFFQDQRHVFFVRADRKTIVTPNYEGFMLTPRFDVPESMPPLVERMPGLQSERRSEPWLEDILLGVDSPIISNRPEQNVTRLRGPAPSQRVPTIQHFLATSTYIPFGQRHIGADGSAPMSLDRIDLRRKLPLVGAGLPASTNVFHNPAVDLELTRRFVPSNLENTQFRYTFYNHFHPFVGELLGQLNRKSIDGLLDPTFHEKPELNFGFFEDLYEPNLDEPDKVAFGDFPMKEIDVSEDGAYAVYNWELLFHAPLTIAVHLSKNQRFEEAQRWLHYIFDPTASDGQFWRFLAFRQEDDPKQIDRLLHLVSTPDDELTDDERPRRDAVLRGYDALRKHPFQPHSVARTRPLAYQYCVVMKYLDNLIAWGDSLFRQDTIETINEATQIYVLAANLLGPRPQRIPPRGTTKPKTFAQLRARGLDELGNTLVELEGQFPFNLYFPATEGVDTDQTNALFGIGRTLYFCIPRNDKLLGYWDTVADRLFKIRHCMTIEGVVRQLPLFEPPIDPGMLVKAAAAGIDISSLVSGLNQPLAPVRSPLLIQKALEICSDVRGLGNALLSALEKKDAEALGLLRQKHEINIQQLAQDVRYLQWKEAESATESLLESRKSALERYRFYQRLLGGNEEDLQEVTDLMLERRVLTEDNFDEVYAELVGQYAQDIEHEEYSSLEVIDEGKLYLNRNEDAALDEHAPKSRRRRSLARYAGISASTLVLLPDLHINLHYWGIGGTVEPPGGGALATASRIAAEYLSTEAALEDSRGASARETASYERRADEWMLQSNLAARELMQIGRQIISSLIREQITHHEYENLKKQIEQAQETDQFLRDKFTNEELYGWMQGELAKLYYEYYKLAFDIARKAEQTMKHELMRPELDEMDFIKFNYWDGGRKGLLAGEALHLDLKRMEMAYHDHNKREYELTKHISLRQLDPVALLALKTGGTCEVTLPEWLFDLDTPGHYMRRIKNVSLSIPAVAGPYTSVNCTLSLLKSTLRRSPQLRDDEYERAVNEEDTRFVDYYGTIQSIVTSNAQNDSGMFEPNLREERFLPFEGAGAESTWRLELPARFRQFDYNTISDVILHVRYTARQGGNFLRQKATAHLHKLIKEADDSGLMQLFSLKHDFPTEWHRFVSSDEDFRATVKKEYFPYFAQGGVINISMVELYSAQEGGLLTAVPDDLNVDDLTTSLRNNDEFVIALAENDVLKREPDARVFLLLRFALE